MKKLFLLDTSVLMRNPQCFYVFDDNDVAICPTTLEELDNLKEAPGEKGYSAREAIREIFKIRDNDNKLQNGGTFKIIDGAFSVDIPGWDRSKPDNIIIFTANSNDAILVTADISMFIKAESAGIKTQIYYNEQASEESLNYTGHTDVFLTPEDITSFYAEGKIELESDDLKINEFINIYDLYTNKGVGLGIYDGKYINKLKYQDIRPCGIMPKNAMQRFALEALLAPAEEIPLVILKGPAGTAKTFLSVAAGLHQTWEIENYNKVLALRPASGFDMTLGYMPGSEEEKAGKYARPVLDNLEVLLRNKDDDKDSLNSKIDYILDKGYLKIESLEFMRGRSVANSFIFIDEVQNATPRQILGILTRAAAGSKIVICGDPDQIDNPKLDQKNNGLTFAAERMMGKNHKGTAICAQLTFTQDDCVRSVLAKEASELLKL